MDSLLEFGISDVLIHDDIWAERIGTVKNKSIFACLQKCKDTSRINNFLMTGKTVGEEHVGASYNDSDVYKILEAIAYILASERDQCLESNANEIISDIIVAQEECGYLNTKYSTKMGTAFHDFNEHEMYNAGHLIEAGIAYYEATGEKALLNAGIRFAEYLMKIFGPGKREWIPGHQEIELALAKLSQIMKDNRYLIFAQWLIDQRGENHEEIDKNRKIDREYCQDLEKPSMLKRIYGHSVRAMYMLTAMAKITRFGGKDYRQALEAVWHNITEKKMYITGGIGSLASNEGFSDDYSLPNVDGYCETCAAVGMVFYNYEMFLQTGEGKYIDIIEREIFNGVLSAMNLEGNQFFYRNVLESDGTVTRKEWFKTACCPTQIVRFVPTIGKYIYSRSESTLFINLFISSELKNFCHVHIKSDYPYSGQVRIVGVEVSGVKELRVRIPYWAKEVKIMQIENLQRMMIDKGFMIFSVLGEFTLEIDFGIMVDKIVTNSKVRDNQNKIALQYGPLVYCLESTDCSDYEHFALGNEQLPLIAELPSALGKGKSIQIINMDNGDKEAMLIPYYLWNNRGTCAMKVFLPIKADEVLYL